MKNKYLRLKAMLLAGVIALTSSSLTGCTDNSNDLGGNLKIASEFTTTFGVREHIISVPISSLNDVRVKNVQYNYYPGYEPVGISLTASNSFGGGAIIYSNVEEVKCSSTIINEKGDYLYCNIGTPLDNDKEKPDRNKSIEEFDVGEHIISVPIKDDNRSFKTQYEFREGYEVVGMATTATKGFFANNYAGGVLLYKNIVPVKCSRCDDGYTTFGIPFEKEKTLK